MDTHARTGNWITSHPIISYVLFTLAWSWSIWSLLFLVIEPGGLLPYYMIVHALVDVSVVSVYLML